MVAPSWEHSHNLSFFRKRVKAITSRPLPGRKRLVPLCIDRIENESGAKTIHRVQEKQNQPQVGTRIFFIHWFTTSLCGVHNNHLWTVASLEFVSYSLE